MNMESIKNSIKIKIQNLNFYYGTSQILHHINLDVFNNQVTAIIGSSGCGKSTLLRCLNRIYTLYPSSKLEGEILLDNVSIFNQNVNELRNKIGMVFQKPAPFPMSIFNNVAFGVRLYESLNKKALVERVEWALHKTSLWNEVKDKLRQSGLGLSGGQQQRLCMARAIAVKPEILLLDEPTSSLDPLSTAKIETLIHELKTEYTILIVTHNMQQAIRVSDYTAYMHLGKLIEYDQTKIIFHSARHEATRDYIEGRIG